MLKSHVLTCDNEHVDQYIVSWLRKDVDQELSSHRWNVVLFSIGRIKTFEAMWKYFFAAVSNEDE